MSLQDEKWVTFWNAKGVNNKKIAEVFFNLSNGDQRVLNTSEDCYKESNSIWGRAHEVLFPGTQNTELGRKLLYRYWTFRRQSVRVHFKAIQFKNEEVSRKPKPTPENAEWRGCICEPFYIDDDEDDEVRIECSQCLRWFHSQCIDVRVSDYEGIDFICGFCEGKMKLPTWLDETRSGDTVATKESDDQVGNANNTFHSKETPALENGGARNERQNLLKDGCISPNQSSTFSNGVNQTSTPSQVSKIPGSSKFGENTKTKFVGTFIRSLANSINPFENTKEKETKTNNVKNYAQKTVQEQSEENKNSKEDDGNFVRRRVHGRLSRNRGSALPDNKPPEPGSLDTPTTTKSTQPKKIFVDESDSEDDDEVLPDYTKFLVKNRSFGSNARPKKKTAAVQPSDHTSSGDESSDDANDDNVHRGSGKKEERKAEGKTLPGVNVANNPDSSEDETPVDTSTHRRAFHIEMSPEEWKKVVTLRPNASGLSYDDYRVKKFYTVALNKAFDIENKVCVLAFSKKELRDSSKPQSPFFRAYAYCSNRTCSARWKFLVRKPPKPGMTVRVHVSLYRGKMMHYASKPKARRWTGDYKNDAIDMMKGKMPAAARLEAAGKADMEAVRNGKTTTLKSNKTFQMIKQKEENAKDMSKDVVRDVAMTRPLLESEFPDKVVPGYIQEFQVFPAKVYLFSYRQMEILHMLHSKGPISILIDATGGLIKPLGDVYDDKRMLLYTILVQSPVKNTPIPISEMVTSTHNHESVYKWLYTFFHAYKRRFAFNDVSTIIKKCEVDFSRVMLTSATYMFAQSSLEEYLNRFWHHYFSGENSKQILDLIPVHVCRFHVLKAIRQKIVNTYTKKKLPGEDKIVDYLMDWTYALTRSKDLHSFDRRVKQVAIITSFEFFTIHVECQIRDMHKRTTRESVPWKDFILADLPHGSPFWSRSAFGQYTHSVFTAVERKNASVKANLPKEDREPNPFYSESFGDYLRTYFLPYFPIISHMVFDACGIKADGDTNNTIEGYFGLLKTNIYKQRRNQKVSRFIRRQADAVKGICNATESDLLAAGLYKNKRKAANTGNKGAKQPMNLYEAKEHYDPDFDSPEEESESELSDCGFLDDDSSDSEWDANDDQVPEEQIYNDDISFETAESNDEFVLSDHSRANAGKEDDLFDSDNEEWGVSQESVDTFKGKNYESKSPMKQTEVFKKNNPRNDTYKETNDFQQLVPVFPYGGTFAETNCPLFYTCSIDTTFQCLLGLMLKIPQSVSFIKEQMKAHEKGDRMTECVGFALNREYNSAKTVWIRGVLGKDPELCDPRGNMIGVEFDAGLKYIAELFPIKKLHRCSDKNCPGATEPGLYAKPGSRRWNLWQTSTIADMQAWTPMDFENAVNNSTIFATPCFCCSAQRLVDIEFAFDDPPFIMYPMFLSPNNGFNERDLPRTQTFKGRVYQLFAYTCLIGNHAANEKEGVPHFVTKFIVGNKRILYDGMVRRPIVEQKLGDHKVSSVWLIPK